MLLDYILILYLQMFNYTCCIIHFTTAKCSIVLVSNVFKLLVENPITPPVFSSVQQTGQKQDILATVGQIDIWEKCLGPQRNP